MHYGIDFGSNKGTFLGSAVAGQTRNVQNDPKSDIYYDPRTYGESVAVESEDTLVVYSHIVDRCVGEGQKVAVGQAVAFSGDSGTPGAEHLHMSAHKRQPDGSWGARENFGPPARYTWQQMVEKSRQLQTEYLLNLQKTVTREEYNMIRDAIYEVDSSKTGSRIWRKGELPSYVE